MADAAVREVRYDRFRRVIERRMIESVTTKPQLTLHRSVDVTSLERALAQARSEHDGAALGFTPTLLAVVARVLAGSRINGTVSNQVISLHEDVHLGVAVDVAGALVVPVVRDASTRSVEDLGTELKRLAKQARSGGLRPVDVDGATFTVSSLGASGVEFFTPIVNPPQLAILGVGAIRENVTLANGVLGSRRMMGLSLSFDHAATDGADAARVLDQLRRAIEAPEVQWFGHP